MVGPDDFRSDDIGVDAVWRARRRGTFTARGFLLLVVVAVLLAGSLRWLQSSVRYRGARELAAAAELIISRSPMEADPDKIFRGAAHGMMSVLDPYSAYLPPAEFNSLTEETEGEYFGIGVEIRLRGRIVVVANVLPRSPAYDAGIRPGDQIIAIDGHATEALTLDEIVATVRGAGENPVLLTILPPTGPERHVRLLPRAVEIEAFPLVGITRSGFGYIRWEHFSLGSADRLAAIIEELRIEDPIGLVIDLRGNPGGVLDEAVSAAGLFLPSNSLVCTLVRTEGSDSLAYRTGSALPIYQDDLIIVQDALSTSAAELFAAALQDSRRAIVVGQRSFGKGWVQSVIPLDDYGGMRLSTAYYLTPSGQRIGDVHSSSAQLDSLLSGGRFEGMGMFPDVRVEPTEQGPWEQWCLREGVFADYVSSRDDDWPAAGLEDSTDLLTDFSQWLFDSPVRPHGTGRALLDRLQKSDSAEAPLRPGKKVLNALAAAVERDDRLQFRRESSALLLRLWEQRIESVEDPDPGELEALIDLDPSLTTARDLLEQPERFDAILAGNAPPHHE